MKLLNENEIYKKELAEKYHLEAVQLMIESQVNALEKLLENNAQHVQSPVAYNMCAGLINQLKYWSVAPFRSAEATLDKNMAAHVEEYAPLIKPNK